MFDYPTEIVTAVALLVVSLTGCLGVNIAFDLGGDRLLKRIGRRNHSDPPGSEEVLGTETSSI